MSGYIRINCGLTLQWHAQYNGDWPIDETYNFYYFRWTYPIEFIYTTYYYNGMNNGTKIPNHFTAFSGEHTNTYCKFFNEYKFPGILVFAIGY